MARSHSKLVELQNEIMSEFLENKILVSVIAADLSNEDTCKNVIKEASEVMGGIDIIVLNHITSSRFGLWLEKENHDFIEEMYRVNFFSYLWLATAAMDHLKASKGQIIVVSSFAGWCIQPIQFLLSHLNLIYFILIGYVGVPNTALYGSTKHALNGFFNSLRTELNIMRVPIDITICIIGATDTEGVGDIKDKIKVTWDHPRSVAHSIVVGSAYKLHEMYHPHIEMYPSVLIGQLFPKLMGKILTLTMPKI